MVGRDIGASLNTWAYGRVVFGVLQPTFTKFISMVSVHCLTGRATRHSYTANSNSLVPIHVELFAGMFFSLARHILDEEKGSHNIISKVLDDVPATGEQPKIDPPG